MWTPGCRGKDMDGSELTLQREGEGLSVVVFVYVRGYSEFSARLRSLR